MKKYSTYYIVLLILSLQFGSVQAQLPANRTSDTKIADLLAQQPSETSEQFQTVMSELEKFTTQDFVALLTKLQEPGSNNAPIEFASNSYAYYLGKDGRESLRKAFVDGLIDAFEKTSIAYNKGFILELMYRSPDPSMIATASTVLSDQYLSDKAARVLANIPSDESKNALLKALETTTDEHITNHIVSALGHQNGDDIESAILSVKDKFQTTAFQRNMLTTLSKVGTEKSLAVFKEFIQKDNYQFAQPSSVGLSLDYLQHLADDGQKKTALDFASFVYKNANGDAADFTKAAAFQFLATQDYKAYKKEVLKNLESPQYALRDAAKAVLLKNSTSSEFKKAMSRWSKYEEDVQLSLLKAAEEDDKATYVTTLAKQANKVENTNVKTELYRYLINSSANKYWPIVFSSLSSSDGSQSKTIENLLLTSKNIPNWSELKSYSNGSNQTLLLDLAEHRKISGASADVLASTSSADTAVKASAFRALPNNVTDADFEKVLELIESSNGKDLEYAQAAAMQVIKSSGDPDAYTDKLLAKAESSSAANNFFPVLAYIGNQKSLDFLLTKIKDNSTRNAAVLTLSSWPSADALRPSIDVLKGIEDGGLFDDAFKAIARNIQISEVAPEQKALLLFDLFDIAKSNAQKSLIIGSLNAVGTYQTLAFAAQYLDDKELSRAATSSVMNIALDHPEFIGASVKDWLEKAAANLSGSESSYLKEAINRHLAEMPSGEGYISLFNGKDLTGWKGLVEDPLKRQRMSATELKNKQASADKKMQQSWIIEDSALTFTGEGDNIATVKAYGDFEMLVDWKLDKNGKEPDAGIYLRGTPQVQIWDISRTDVGAQVGSGGLYNNQKHERNPLKVADNPLGEWNTFKIKMIDESVWVWLNGELVVDSVTLENYWDRNQSIFPTEQIELQAHGSKVWYRNIFLKEIPRKEVSALSSAEKNEGFEFLFDGQDLDKWLASPAYEITPEGYLRSNPDAKFGKNLYTKEEFGDFVYRFEFKLTPGANNGVGIRAPLEGDAAYQGMEIQVLDDSAEIYKDLAPYQYHGSVYGIIAAKRGSLRPMGEWNEQEIRIQGNKIKVIVNGKVIVDGDLAEATKSGSKDHKEHPGLQNKSGHIGFLGHGSEVFFRNIRIKKL